MFGELAALLALDFTVINYDRQGRGESGDTPPYAVEREVEDIEAETVQQYIKAGLLDEIQIHLVPVLFGQGIQLFDRAGPKHIELERTGVIESPGVTHLRFRVVK
jgi:hypothetical protein